MMPSSSTTLYIFVEGPDDKRFFEKIIIPILENRYLEIKIIEYAGWSPDEISPFMRSMNKNPDWATYIFVHDFDVDSCITKKKANLCETYFPLKEEYLYIVVTMIESWYLSGTSNYVLRKNRIRTSVEEIPSNANKEYFERLISSGSNDRVKVMTNILDNFSIDVAVVKNKSFKYMIKKLSTRQPMKIQ